MARTDRHRNEGGGGGLRPAGASAFASPGRRLVLRPANDNQMPLAVLARRLLLWGALCTAAAVALSVIWT